MPLLKWKGAQTKPLQQQIPRSAYTNSIRINPVVFLDLSATRATYIILMTRNKDN
jgi:hypothetical protein